MFVPQELQFWLLYVSCFSSLLPFWMVLTLFLFSCNNWLPNTTGSICWKSNKGLNNTFLIGFNGNVDLYVSFRHSQSRKKKKKVPMSSNIESNRVNEMHVSSRRLEVSRGLRVLESSFKTAFSIFGFLWPGRTRRIWSSRAKGNFPILVWF